MRRTIDAILVLAVPASVACTSSSPSTEIPCANVSASCKPQYDPPVYDTIFTKILQPTCASGTGTCHTADAAKGGLVFVDASQSHAMLLGTDGSRARVKPMDPSCSLLVERLTATDPSFHMPPGPSSISSGELCTIVQWIAAGAKR